jgi:hypothetical protein
MICQADWRRVGFWNRAIFWYKSCPVDLARLPSRSEDIFSSNHKFPAIFVKSLLFMPMSSFPSLSFGLIRIIHKSCCQTYILKTADGLIYWLGFSLIPK